MKDYSDLTIIIPTLNEKENISDLIKILENKYNNVKIIISDDGSKDNTKKIIKKLIKKNKNIKFLDRKNKEVHGITASVINALIFVNTNKIIIMDGDMQHPPHMIKGIFKELDNSDIVIATRTYVKNWGLKRKIISRTANYFVYTIFLLRRKQIIKDMMSGFFGIKTQLFKKLVKTNHKKFVGEGYKILVDILRLLDKKVNIKEINYTTFHYRKKGKSKLNYWQFFNLIKSTLK